MNLIFFDIDGTLLLSQGAGGRSIIRVMKAVFGVQDEIARVQIHGQTDRGIATQLFDAHSIEDNDENWNEFTSAYLEILDEELVKSDGSLLPGIPELLVELEQKSQVEIALLTGNIARGAHKKVEFFGIGDFFSWGGYGDHHRDRSDMARHAVEVAKTKIDYELVENIFVIGDTPNDIRCGKAIGATTIGVATAGYSIHDLTCCEPDVVLEDLANTHKLVSILS